MGFSDEVKNISENILKHKDSVENEEATKISFIMPFVRALGYDTTNPREVRPEYTAFVDRQKKEKVDYAIMIDDKPVMLFECKDCNNDLDDWHSKQLSKYFAFTESKFGVLTNGITYQFYTDLENPNKMDDKPFLEIDITDLKKHELNELKKFTKNSFNPEKIFESANELKYTVDVNKVMEEQLRNPSDDFIKFFVKKTYPKIIFNQKTKEQFREITKTALKRFITDQVDERLTTALKEDEEKIEEPSETVNKTLKLKEEIYTTEEEWEGYYTIKSILRNNMDVKRLKIHDKKSYCAILLDGYVKKPICRFRFNGRQKYLGLIDPEEIVNGMKKENKVPIDTLDDIYDYADKIIETYKKYEI